MTILLLQIILFKGMLGYLCVLYYLCMMKSLFFFPSIFCLLLFVACHSSSYQELPDDTTLRRLLEESPDSLATLLEEEINPFLLSDMERADYGFWLTNAHRRQGRNLINDTLIFYTLDYYKTTDSPRLMEAYILAANQINSTGNKVIESKQVLNEALRIAESKNDTIGVKGIIHKLIYLDLTPSDKERPKELIRLTQRFIQDKQDFLSYINLLLLYENINQFDSAGIYSKKGLELAQKYNNTFMEYFFGRKESDHLNATGRNKEALEILRKLEGNSHAGNELNFNYAMTFIGLGQSDSTQVYLNAIQEVINKYKYEHPEEAYIIETISKSIEAIAKAKTGKPMSLNDLGMGPDGVLTYSRDMIKADRERQALQNKLLKDKFTLEIERGELRQRSLWGGIIILLIVTVVIFIYQRKLLSKERFVQQTKEKLRLRSIQLSENELTINRNQELIKDLSAQLDESGDLQQEIDLLIEKNKGLSEKNDLLQKDIIQYSKSMDRKDQELSVYEQLAEGNAKLQERERFLTVQLIAHTAVLDKLSKKPRYIEESQWPEITHAVNQLFDGFTYRLHTSYSTLSDEDIRYCTLIRLRLSTSVIATLTGISPSSVTKRKQRIKEKMNQQRPAEIQKEQPLEIYLWNF